MLLEILPDRGRRGVEGFPEGLGELAHCAGLGQAFPDEGGDLVQGVDGIQVPDLPAEGHEDRLAGDVPGDKVLGLPVGGGIG